MAINTRGFEVNVMPQYSPVDPRLAAFNPSEMSRGALQAFQLAQSLEQMKAFKALQDELTATRSGRIKASNTKADVATAEGAMALRQLPQVESNTNMKLFNDAKILPLKGQFDLAALQENLTSLPVLAEAERAGAKVATGNAEIDLTTMPYKGDAALAQAMGASARAPAAELIKDDAQRAAAAQAETELIVAQAKSDYLRANPAATAIELKAVTDEALARSAIAQTSQKTGIRPSSSILPPGAQFSRQIETEAAKLGLMPQQYLRLVGNPLGMSIINKLSINKKGDIITRQALTQEENVMLQSLFVEEQAAQQQPVIEEDVTEEVVEDKFQVGQTYTDGQGNTAVYEGNGKWSTE